MKLDDGQRAQFAEQGYVFIPGLFSDPEIKVLMDEVPGIYGQLKMSWSTAFSTIFRSGAKSATLISS